MNIYLDNAATTPLDPAVFAAITPYLLNHYGNPSALHTYGRQTRQAIEDSRATIAGLLNALPEEIIFTSGGTAADNMAIVSAIVNAKIDHVITTPFEHPAVLQTLRSLVKSHRIAISYLRHDHLGNLDLDHLHYLLRTNTRNLVSVMHGNNETGNLHDIEKISAFTAYFGGLFHTDAVQTMGHYSYDLADLPVQFLAASDHKFHGPKGIGFLYARKGTQVSRLIHGGGQERGLRSGTENIPGIVGLAKALEIAYESVDQDRKYIQSLKDRLISRLKDVLPEIRFNGNSANAEKSLFTVLSANLPDNRSDLIRLLDEQGIAVSGGSACSGSSASHVLAALGVDAGSTTIRFSFSKCNTPAEIDRAAETLAALCHLAAA